MGKKQKIIHRVYIDKFVVGMPVQLYDNSFTQYWTMNKILEKLNQEVKEKQINPKEILYIFQTLTIP